MKPAHTLAVIYMFFVLAACAFGQTWDPPLPFADSWCRIPESNAEICYDGVGVVHHRRTLQEDTAPDRKKYAAVQRGNRFTSYVANHKELIAANTIILLARMADAASSVHCLNVSINCKEGNPLLGKRPSNAQEYGYGGGMAALQIALNHLLWHFAPEPSMRHAIWLPTAGFALGEYFIVKQNANDAEFEQEFCPPTCSPASHMAAARARVMR